MVVVTDHGSYSRKDFSEDVIYKNVKAQFAKIASKYKVKMGISNICQSVLAMFSLKKKSLLQYDKYSRDQDIHPGNLLTLFGIDKYPSDTYIREVLDRVAPDDLRPIFKYLFAKAQRGKLLDKYRYMPEGYLISVDGTGYFSSEKVKCKNCCSKHHRSGKITYYHQMLCASLVSPDCKQVFSFAPEAIQQQDGNNKNDSERSASKRMLEKIRQDHPKLDIIIVEDGLYGNGPHLQLLAELNMRYIISVKEKDHQLLYESFHASEEVTYKEIKRDKLTHKFSYINGLPLNATHFDKEVNMLYYEEHKEGKDPKVFCWITDIPITQANMFNLMRGGRSRWKIENETFNTLKNQGYNFEHNYGHGYQHLSSVMANIMLIAFFIDQLKEMTSASFKRCIEYIGSKREVWHRMRGAFSFAHIADWYSLYSIILAGWIPTKQKLIIENGIYRIETSS